MKNAILRVIAPAARLAPGPVGENFAYIADRDALEGGRRPARLRATVSAQLSRADAALRGGEIEGATEHLVKAITLSHHPLVRDEPHEMLALLRTSSCFARVSRQSSRRAVLPAQEGEPLRLLAISRGSFTFLDPVLEGLAKTGRVEIRRRDLAEIVPREEMSLRGIIRARLEDDTIPCPASLREDAEWADTLWVEWGHHTMAWASIVAWPGLRVCARLHRFEARTPFPLLADLGRIDRLMFVADHVRALLMSLLPAESEAVPTVTIGNVLEADRFDLPKSEGADRTLCQVVWDRPGKDVSWSIRVLERLREEDPRWRLLLVGSHAPNAAELIPRHLVECGAIEMLGQRSDVHEAVRGAGYVLSASLEEGTQESIAECAAARCVPVVRDWPRSKPYGGAASVYPEDWVVEDEEAAVLRIRGVVESGRDDQGEVARTWVLEHRDLSRTLEQYLEVLAGRRSDSM